MQIKINSDGNPIVDQLSEEGFVDLTFRLRSLVDDGDKYHFHLAAAKGDHTLGMNVIVVKGIKALFDSNMTAIKGHVYRKGVRFLRSGEDSDRLVSVLGELYGHGRSSLRMVDELTFTAVALTQGDLDMEAQPVRLKLFAKDDEPVDENAYCESFFNLDLVNRWAFWNEKDPDYRDPLLRALIA